MHARSKTMYIINNLLPVLVGNMVRHCTRVQYLPILPTNPANKIYLRTIMVGSTGKQTSLLGLKWNTYGSSFWYLPCYVDFSQRRYVRCPQSVLQLSPRSTIEISFPTAQAFPVTFACSEEGLYLGYGRPHVF